MTNVPGKTITKAQLDEMFESIREAGQWDMSKPLLWGYFFTDTDTKKLETLASTLVEMGYQLVDIFQERKENPSDPDKFFLHVEKTEIHDSTSLDKRNDSLFILAHEVGIESYDGMDVGPVEE